MTSPAPRPALRRAPDAHIHPAAPGHSLHALRPAPSAAPAVPQPRPDTETFGGTTDLAAGTAGKGPHRLSGPLRGTTSDSLRASTRKTRTRSGGKSREKPVDLGVKVPKSLRKDFRAAAKADRKDPDAVVVALLKAWLGT